MTTLAGSFSPAAERSLGDKYLRVLAGLLLGYALFDKGFAYLGLPPLFIGEIILFFGIIVAMATPNWSRLFEIRALYALIPLVLWGLYRTFPYIPQDGITALRDATVFGYSAFGVILALLLVNDPSRLGMLIQWYRKYWRIFLLAIPVLFILFRFFRSVLPAWPWAPSITLVYIKEGDVMVHLAAILAFWVAGFEVVKWGWFALMAFCVATLGLVDRAGMLSFFAIGAICLILRPKHTAAWRLILLACLAVVGLWLSSVNIPIPGGKGRDISFRQMVINAGSLLGTDSGNLAMDSNKDWRLDWWGDIVDYTFHGRYFWKGKGYGINLADSDGYQLFQDDSLRSPHSAHMTFLARGGVPGLVFWVLVPLCWGIAILRAYIRSKKNEQTQWEGVFAFVGAFGIALLINASFDVYLEGPMGGIWFWCVYGFGLGALWIYENCPEALAQPLPEPEPATAPISRRAFSIRPR